MTAVDSLTIGRLHTRYVGVDANVASELDDVMRDVVRGSLERVANDLLDSASRSPWAVCIASVDVGIDLDLRRSRDAVASQWARDLVGAVVRAVESADSTGGAVVVYRTEHQALRDLVVGAARQRWAHHWAWQQLALVGDGASPPTGIEVAEALAARPAAAGAVIASCRGDAWRVIPPIGWILIAGAVARASGEQPPAGWWVRRNLEPRPSNGGGRAEPTDGERPDRPIGTALVERIVAAIPAAAWTAAEGAQSRALALLAATMVAPHAARRTEVLDAVVARAEQAMVGPPNVDARSRTSARPDTSTPSPRSSSTVAPDGPGGRDVEFLPEPTHTSGFGGVWYLVRLITELDVMVRLARHDAARAPDLLAAVVGRVTGVPADDPAVVLLAGTDSDRSLDDADAGRDVDDAAAADDTAIVAALAVELADELTRRGGGRLVDRDLGELWRRPAEMTVGIGTIDVVFGLDDVELDVRVLGLDVDPGFVWWSGSIVRFDYV